MTDTKRLKSKKDFILFIKYNILPYNHITNWLPRSFWEKIKQNKPNLTEKNRAFLYPALKELEYQGYLKSVKKIGTTNVYCNTEYVSNIKAKHKDYLVKEKTSNTIDILTQKKIINNYLEALEKMQSLF